MSVGLSYALLWAVFEDPWKWWVMSNPKWPNFGVFYPNHFQDFAPPPILSKVGSSISKGILQSTPKKVIATGAWRKRWYQKQKKIGGQPINMCQRISFSLESFCLLWNSFIAFLSYKQAAEWFWKWARSFFVSLPSCFWAIMCMVHVMQLVYWHWYYSMVVQLWTSWGTLLSEPHPWFCLWWASFIWTSHRHFQTLGVCFVWTQI